MVKPQGALVAAVTGDSIAEELEIIPGDRLLSINGRTLADFIDYIMLSSEAELTLEIEKTSGEIFEIEFEKDPDEPLGLTFDNVIFDKIETCSNHCLFCFVHQLPAGQRETLYVQDDDYRLSFLQGSYVTLTNLTESDWNRIKNCHLSPLYISVHATNPQVRQKLLGSKLAGTIREQLRQLADWGIMMHTQAVLCPGINDGQILEETITDLAQLYPAVNTLAVVPVGLTGHRTRLYPLQNYTKEAAAEVVKLVEQYQANFLEKIGTRFVFAADEWYIKAELPLPSDEAYEGYLQLDNGVGLTRWFLTEFIETFIELKTDLKKIKANYVIISGKSTTRMWEEIITLFKRECPGINLEICTVTNQFLGASVTVTGLLSGQDIAAAIINDGSTADAVYLIPQITLKQGENRFLDDWLISELIEKCQSKRIAVVPTRAGEWLDWILKEGCVAG